MSVCGNMTLRDREAGGHAQLMSSSCTAHAQLMLRLICLMIFCRNNCNSNKRLVEMLYLQFKSSSCFMLITSFFLPNKVRLQFYPRAEAAAGALVSYAGGISTNIHILISSRLQSVFALHIPCSPSLYKKTPLLSDQQNLAKYFPRNSGPGNCVDLHTTAALQ